MKHEDRCTLWSNEDDRDILTRRLFNVNMRLYQANMAYRGVVRMAASYIRSNAMLEAEGYKKPHGFSGANAGIPFNIIALADGTVMINPCLVETSGEKVSESNCGSLLLEKPILIKRHAHVKVSYYNLAGDLCQMEGYLPTVQHEIDHNRGILIWDRMV